MGFMILPAIMQNAQITQLEVETIELSPNNFE
jgi:hypothetical protein